MGFVDSAASLIATCGGDTVKLFDLTVDAGDPCTLSYAPSPGSQVNSVKWNHTNLVVASAGDDKKISLWNKNGQTMGFIPPKNDLVDDIEESINSISFSNKSSRYICSGGSGHIVKIWDLQRKRCIKWLSGHSDTITGVMYNCKDEHLASISVKGDLIVHNLASGARAAELKDPNGQVLRVLDYSRFSRHVLSTAGDDGSVHLWDTTSRSPKVSWLKLHSAPTSGVCFSPSSDKIIASVGLDKKLYIFDFGTKRPTSCMPFEAPFSALAYSDDGNTLAAGTNSGRVVFYDVRGKPQPFTVLRAYNSSEAIISLSWQRSKPVTVNEKNCTAEVALLGGTSEDSVLMPDPLPSVGSSNFPSVTMMPSFRSSTSTAGSISTTSKLSTEEESSYRSSLWTGGTLSKLQAVRSSYDLKDDMDVFSPLVDVQPITPSVGSWWNDHDDVKKDKANADRKSTIYSSSTRRFPLPEASTASHPISDWRFTSTSRQDDNPSQSCTASNATSSKSELSLSQAPESLVGNALPEKLINNRQPASLSRFLPSMSLPSGSGSAGLMESSSSAFLSTNSSLINPNITSMNLQKKILYSDSNSSTFSESSSGYHPTSAIMAPGTKTMPSSVNLDSQGTVLSTLPRRYMTYSERISTNSAFSENASTVGSPKSKKTGQETKEELMTGPMFRQDASAVSATGGLPAINVVPPQPSQVSGQPADPLLGSSSFSLQLVQRTLEESLGSVQKSIHEDVRNLHLDLLRQFHMQEVEMSRLLAAVLEKQDELMKEVQSLRRENQQLRRLL